MSRRIRALAICAAVSCSSPSAAASLFRSPDPPRRRRLQDGSIDSSTTTPKHIQTYKLWEPAQISETLLKWADHYPEFVRVTTAQKAYGLPRAGTADDCPFDEGGDGCLNYIVTIQDFVKNPEDSESSSRLPEVL